MNIDELTIGEAKQLTGCRGPGVKRGQMKTKLLIIALLTGPVFAGPYVELAGQHDGIDDNPSDCRSPVRARLGYTHKWEFDPGLSWDFYAQHGNCLDTTDREDVSRNAVGYKIRYNWR